MIVNATVSGADKPRLSRQCSAILEMLRVKPRTSFELAQVALKYTSRISDIRAAGYRIECERGDGVNTYTLLPPDETQLKLL
jgi:hypothetical protein